MRTKIFSNQGANHSFMLVLFLSLVVACASGDLGPPSPSLNPYIQAYTSEVFPEAPPSPRRRGAQRGEAGISYNILTMERTEDNVSWPTDRYAWVVLHLPTGFRDDLFINYQQNSIQRSKWVTSEDHYVFLRVNKNIAGGVDPVRVWAYKQGSPCCRPKDALWTFVTQPFD
jgi:hypothetical protein